MSLPAFLMAVQHGCVPLSGTVEKWVLWGPEVPGLDHSCAVVSCEALGLLLTFSEPTSSGHSTWLLHRLWNLKGSVDDFHFLTCLDWTCPISC